VVVAVAGVLAVVVALVVVVAALGSHRRGDCGAA
jgi:hypothetical protein